MCVCGGNRGGGLKTWMQKKKGPGTDQVFLQGLFGWPHVHLQVSGWHSGLHLSLLDLLQVLQHAHTHFHMTHTHTYTPHTYTYHTHTRHTHYTTHTHTHLYTPHIYTTHTHIHTNTHTHIHLTHHTHIQITHKDHTHIHTTYTHLHTTYTHLLTTYPQFLTLYTSLMHTPVLTHVDHFPDALVEESQHLCGRQVQLFGQHVHPFVLQPQCQQHGLKTPQTSMSSHVHPKTPHPSTSPYVYLNHPKSPHHSVL